MSAILEELVKAAKYQVKRDDPTFIAGLVSAVSDPNIISEEEWQKISLPAQTWHNEAADALTAGKPVPPFPDESAAPAVTPAATTTTAATPGKRGRKKGEPKPPPPPKPVKVSAASVVRVVTCSNPDWTREQVMAEVTKQGHTLSVGTVNMMYAEIHNIIHTLVGIGKMANPYAVSSQAA